jgi:hypothetical protein
MVAVVGTCPIAKIENPGNACNLAQDDVVDCCNDGRDVRCPAAVISSSALSATTEP